MKIETVGIGVLKSSRSQRFVDGDPEKKTVRHRYTFTVSKSILGLSINDVTQFWIFFETMFRLKIYIRIQLRPFNCLMIISNTSIEDKAKTLTER